MKKFLALALILGFMGARSLVLAETMDMDKDEKAQKTTVTGILVDVACYIDDGATGNDHMDMKKCGTECLKGGSPAGLLVGKKLYILAFPAPVFMDYVGKTVELTGMNFPGNILIPVKAAQVDKAGKKTNINIKGKAMM